MHQTHTTHCRLLVTLLFGICLHETSNYAVIEHTNMRTLPPTVQTALKDAIKKRDSTRTLGTLCLVGGACCLMAGSYSDNTAIRCGLTMTGATICIAGTRMLQQVRAPLRMRVTYNNTLYSITHYNNATCLYTKHPYILHVPNKHVRH